MPAPLAILALLAIPVGLLIVVARILRGRDAVNEGSPEDGDA